MPENFRKKEARDAKVLKEMKEGRVKAKTERAEKRKLILANGEKYHKEYTAADLALIEAKRSARAAGNYFVEPENKIIFAIRIKG